MSQNLKPSTPTLQIAAVFATMDRSETAQECVQALARQTRPVDLVVVADNVSSDDTADHLEAISNLPFSLIVHRMTENRGNAGGVEEAMAIAFINGADAVWILDDDSWPREKALEQLLAGQWDPKVVRHSIQIDPITEQFTWPLQVDEGAKKWRLVDRVEQLPPGDFIKTRINWTGALLSREVRESVGPVNGELFIRGEDEEYPWRIEKAGFAQEAAVHSILDHPGPNELIHLTFLNKHFFFERGLVDWKLYYKVRNMIWLKKRQSGKLRAILMTITYSLASSWFDGAQRLPLVWRAARDGWTGRLGKMRQ